MPGERHPTKSPSCLALPVKQLTKLRAPSNACPNETQKMQSHAARNSHVRVSRHTQALEAAMLNSAPCRKKSDPPETMARAAR